MRRTTTGAGERRATWTQPIVVCCGRYHSRQSCARDGCKEAFVPRVQMGGAHSTMRALARLVLRQVGRWHIERSAQASLPTAESMECEPFEQLPHLHVLDLPACQLGSKHRSRLIQHELRTGRRRRTVLGKCSLGAAGKRFLGEIRTFTCSLRDTKWQADRGGRAARKERLLSRGCYLWTLHTLYARSERFYRHTYVPTRKKVRSKALHIGFFSANLVAQTSLHSDILHPCSV